MARNWTVIGKYPVNNAKGQVESTVIQLQATEPSYASFSETVKGDYLSAGNQEVINVALEAYFNSEYVGRAMGEAVQKVETTVADVKELKEATAEAKETLAELKEMADKIPVLELQVASVKSIVKASELTPEQRQEFLAQFSEWTAGEELQAEEVVTYEKVAYEVIQGHTTQEGWEPDKTPSLFKVYNGGAIFVENDKGELEEKAIVNDFVQPTGSHDAYKKGDRVTFEGKVYESLADNNVYSPKDYAQNWQVVE